jgi:hypothetical protein
LSRDSQQASNGLPPSLAKRAKMTHAMAIGLGNGKTSHNPCILTRRGRSVVVTRDGAKHFANAGRHSDNVEAFIHSMLLMLLMLADILPLD